VLTCIKDIKFKYNPSKCVFASKDIKVLGCVVSKTWMMPDLQKVQTIFNFSIPMFVTNV
jgi:hypothetical protein